MREPAAAYDRPRRQHEWLQHLEADELHVALAVLLVLCLRALSRELVLILRDLLLVVRILLLRLALLLPPHPLCLLRIVILQARVLPRPG